MHPRTRPEALIWWLRNLCAVVCLANLGTVTWELAGGDSPAWNGAAAAFLLGVMTHQTRCIRKIRRLNRPRPDYARITQMERDLSGRYE